MTSTQGVETSVIVTTNSPSQDYRTTFFDFHLSKLGGKLVFLGNLNKKDASKLNVKDNCLQELIEIWADFNYRDSFDSQRDFSGSLIWNNSLVRIAGKAVFYKNWAKAGVKNIKDLMITL